MEEIYNDIELFKLYIKDWSELYIHFCWHKNETPKNAWNKRIFKEHFTFERWKQGFKDYQQNIKFTTKFTNEIEGVEINDVSIRLYYKMFHFVPFNIRKELNNY